VKLPPEIAAIHPDADTRPFWEFCARRELRFQRCAPCGRFRHPPKPGCPHCGAAEVEWVRVAGRGRVFSYTIVHHPTVPALADLVPYSVVVVEFDDAPGVRMISNLADVPPGAVQIDMAVEVAWDEAEPGVALPRLRALA
jgi:uncharacterized OB-fold protein